MNSNAVTLLIAGSSVLTFLIRYIPVAMLHGRKLPRMLHRFLTNLPVAVLAAMTAQSVFVKSGSLYSGLEDFYLIGFLVSVALALKTKNIAVIVFGSLAVIGLLTVLTR